MFKVFKVWCWQALGLHQQQQQRRRRRQGLKGVMLAYVGVAGDSPVSQAKQCSSNVASAATK